MKHPISITLCALLLGGWAAAHATTMDMVQICRTNGAIAYAIALNRDEGLSINASLQCIQHHAQSLGAPPERLAYLAMMVHDVYKHAGLIPDEHRTAQELTCVDKLARDPEQHIPSRLSFEEARRLFELEGHIHKLEAEQGRKQATRAKGLPHAPRH